MIENIVVLINNQVNKLDQLENDLSLIVAIANLSFEDKTTF